MFPVNLLMEKAPWIFSVLGVTHPLEEGAKRYVEVLTGEPKWDTGSLALSGCARAWIAGMDRT